MDLSDRLVSALSSNPTEVTSRCTGIGRRYEASIQSALTRRAESWEWRPDLGGCWANTGGQFSSRGYAVHLTDLREGTIAVSSASNEDDVTVFTLDEMDALLLSERLVQVSAYLDAADARHLGVGEADDDDRIPVEVVHHSDLHGDQLRWYGVVLDPNGEDQRPHRGCRSGKGDCPECAEHQRRGHVLVDLPEDRRRLGGATEGTVYLCKRPVGRAFPGDPAVEFLTRAGVQLAQEPVHGRAWGEVVDQAAFYAALAGALMRPSPEPIPEPAPTRDPEPLAVWEILLVTDLTEDEAAAVDGSLAARIVAEVTAELGAGVPYCEEATRRIRASVA